MLTYKGSNLILADILEDYGEKLEKVYKDVLGDRSKIVDKSEKELFDKFTFVNEFPDKILFGVPWYVDLRDAEKIKGVRLHTAPMFSDNMQAEPLVVLWNFLESYNFFVQYSLQEFPSISLSYLIDPDMCNPAVEAEYMEVLSIQNDRRNVMLYNEEFAHHLRGYVWDVAGLGAHFEERVKREIVDKNDRIEDVVDSIENWYNFFAERTRQVPTIQSMMDFYKVIKHPRGELEKVNREAERLRKANSRFFN